MPRSSPSHTNSSAAHTFIASNLLATAGIDTNPPAGATAYYVVSAVNQAGVEGSNSIVVTNVVAGLSAALVNYSFETNTAGTQINFKTTAGFNESGVDAVAGWLDAGATYNDSGVDYAGDASVTAENGSVVAYCDGGDGGAYQIVGYPLSPGTQVKLTWWAKSSFNSGSQNVALLAASSPSSAFATLTGLTNSTAALSNTGNGGAYTQYTLIYTAAPAVAGQYVGVSFANPGASGTFAMFDNFNLSFLAPPAAPGGLNAMAGDGQVVLGWNAVTGATGYSLEQSLTSGGPWTIIATNTTNLAFTNTGLTDGLTYYYVVAAVNAAGGGAGSAAVTATPLPPLPAVPAGFTAAYAGGRVNLNWSGVPYATGYALYRSLIPGGFDTFVADVTPSPGLTYYYSVTATNLAGSSSFSSQASVTLPPLTLGGLARLGTNLVVNGSNGLAGMNYFVLMTTNLSLSLTGWSIIATNQFGTSGGLGFTNPWDNTTPQKFFRLSIP